MFLGRVYAGYTGLVGISLVKTGPGSLGHPFWYFSTGQACQGIPVCIQWKRRGFQRMGKGRFFVFFSGRYVKNLKAFIMAVFFSQSPGERIRCVFSLFYCERSGKLETLCRFFREWEGIDHPSSMTLMTHAIHRNSDCHSSHLRNDHAWAPQFRRCKETRADVRKTLLPPEKEGL